MICSPLGNGWGPTDITLVLSEVGGGDGAQASELEEGLRGKWAVVMQNLTDVLKVPNLTDLRTSHTS